MSNNTLKNVLLEFLEAHPAHVDAKKAFQDLNPANRHKKVKNFSHTIWEELEHLKIAQEDILQYMLTSNWKSPKWPQEYWPVKKEKISEQEWNHSMNGFFSDLKKVQDFVKNSGVNLIEKIPHAKNHTYLREILLIIDHNAYHLGKIVEMRKAFKNW